MNVKETKLRGLRVNEKESESDFGKGRKKSSEHINVIEHRSEGVNEKMTKTNLEEWVEISGVPMDEIIQYRDNNYRAGENNNARDIVNIEAGVNINEFRRAYVNVNGGYNRCYNGY